MADGKLSLMDKLLHRSSLNRWSRAADLAARLPLSSLRDLRGNARQMRREIDRVLQIADNRLALPLIGKAALRWPDGADWAWRPDFWRGPVPVPGHAAAARQAELSGDATLFHDCRDSQIVVRQIRNTRETDLAPYGARVDVFGFDGDFLSVAVQLPEEAARTLRKRHVLRIDCLIQTETPIDLYARVNLRHGPNTEHMVVRLAPSGERVVAEFDLAYTRINEKRMDKAWIDIIFEEPQMNRILLRDVTVSRRPRAEL